ncbi:hypothetical protein FRC07_011136, partial [Ceratobasidium sp. 392]
MSRIFAFPSNSDGPALVYLLSTSFAFSVTSFALSLQRYYFGRYSVDITSIAWLLTIIHHVVLYCVLPRRRQDEDQPESMPRCVKHAGNIGCLHYLSIFWLGGGLSTLVVTAIQLQHGNLRSRPTQEIYFNFVSGGLAIAESILLLEMCVLSWKALSREGYAGVIG